MVRNSVLACLLVACAGTPNVRPDEPVERLTLRERPEVATHYLTHFELRFSVYGRVVRARRVLLSTVVAADADGSLLEHEVVSQEFDLVDPRLVLPPTRGGLVGATIRERRDRRGRRAGNLFLIEGSPSQQAELEANAFHQLIGAPGLPEASLAPGDSWTGPARWAYRLGTNAPLEAVPEVTYRVSEVSGPLVTVSVQGELQSDDGDVLVEGEIGLNRANALIAYGRLAGTKEIQGSSMQYTITWRTVRLAGASRGFERDHGSLIPRSRVFEADACDARIAELTGRMDVAPTGMPLTTDVTVPSAGAGQGIPWAGRVVLSEGGYAVLGEAADLDRVIEVLELWAQNAAALYPEREEPARVLIIAGESTPVTRFTELAGRLPAEGFQLYLVVRVASAPPPMRPFTPGTPPGVEALGRSLDPSEIASLALGTCAPLIEAWSGSANMDPEAAWTLHRVEIPSALRACGCRGTDVDMIDALLLRVATGERDPQLRVLSLPLDAGSVRLSRRATMADLAASLEP